MFFKEVLMLREIRTDTQLHKCQVIINRRNSKNTIGVCFSFTNAPLVLKWPQMPFVICLSSNFICNLSKQTLNLSPFTLMICVISTIKWSIHPLCLSFECWPWDLGRIMGNETLRDVWLQNQTHGSKTSHY